jgi:hypothetical protein
MPVPFDHIPPDFNSEFYEKQWGKLVKAWKWHDKDGNWIFCTARYEKNVKGKDKPEKNIIPFHYKNGKWKTGHELNENRPIMNLNNIIDSKKEILLVEGEKCYDYATERLKNFFDITTWCGGTGGIVKTYWNFLKEKTVYYWYDNDDPGRKTIDFLKTKLDKLILVHPPGDKPPQWDIADACLDGWDEDTLFIWIKQYAEFEKKEKNKFVDNINFPFKIIGPGSGHMFFLHGETGMIFSVKQGSLNNSHLQYLAPLDFWKDAFGYETKKGVSISWQDAQDVLIRACNSKEPFDHNKIRGRGIWQDGSDLVIHTGSKLIGKNQEIDIRDYSPNGHIYEKTIELKLDIIKSEMSEFEIANIKNCIQKLSIANDLEKLYLIDGAYWHFGGGA